MKKLLVILGPTATGKTDLAIHLAKKFNGELVSADSRQVYKDLDIGTGKWLGELRKIKKLDSRWIIDGVPVYLYDVVSAKKQYTVADYFKDASKIISDISIRGRLPILVGGTGLYIKGLLEGFDNLSVPVSKSQRIKLTLFSLIELQEKLKSLSKNRFRKMTYSDQQNPRRLVRAIELEINKDKQKIKPIKGLEEDFDILKLGLTANRKTLYTRSDIRVIKRINQGLIDEAKKLKEKGLGLSRMKQLGLEYGVLADYLDGKIKDKEVLVKTLQNKIHGYIRRQLTWFKKQKEIIWFDVANKRTTIEVEKLITKWYYLSNATQD